MKLKPEQSWVLDDSNIALKSKCELLTFPIDDATRETINKMCCYVDACYQDKAKEYQITSGIALAANQLGLKKQIIYIHFNSDKENKYLIANPKIISESLGKCYIAEGEGCLSVKNDHQGYVKRSYKIIVEAIDLLNDNQKIRIIAEGILAICLQHEIDHLNGILYYERINPNQPFYVEDDWIKF